MAQKEEKILPEFINLDTAYERLEPNESPFIKGLSMDTTGNPSPQGIGTSNPSGEGQNSMVLTPTRSNKAIPGALLPSGYNKALCAFESITTQEQYHCNYNGKGTHGIYLYDGNLDKWFKVIEDASLGFSNDPKAFISNHRLSIRVEYNNDGSVKEKFLIITDGNTWQKLINVVAATLTNGFDSIQFPYFKLQPPHFDRRALLEYAVRPPMVKPVVTLLPNTGADTSKINNLADKGFQFCYDYVYTDGRPTAASPYSLPMAVSTTDYLTNAQTLPKKASLLLSCDGPMVEKINIYVRQATVEDGKGSLIAPEWGDWYLYDTIIKFESSGANDPSIIKNAYWNRTNPWINNSYDPIQNTIQYIFDASKQGQLVDQNTINRLFNEIPTRSRALSDLGDAILLANNEYGYNNFSKTVLNKIQVSVQEKQTNNCNITLRKVRLYAYVGRCGDDFSYVSQVGFTNGTDTKVRFGGLSSNNLLNPATIDIQETKGFGLDFADKNAFRCYIKGTKYYADGTWYQVNSDNSLVKLDSIYDFSNPDILTGVQKIFDAGGYFVCVFDLEVPAGKYIAAIGRHNVDNSGDYRNTSTYVYGIANSRIKSTSPVFISGIQITKVVSIKPNAINSFEKEMEIDCINSDVDTWGNNNDLFYIYCPYTTKRGNTKHRFIEGYLFESQSNPLPLEKFGYLLNHSSTDDCGKFTDKNGFYWSYTKVQNADIVDTEFHVNINCAGANTTVFTIPTSQSGVGWMKNAVAYLSDHNNGKVGDCNRILVRGKITGLDNITVYSNIAISIVGGSTVYSKSDGTFELVVHNGGTPSQKRFNNIYINAGGNFQISIAGCGQVPTYFFDESLVPCNNCTVRIYPIPINLALNVISSSDTSLKEGGKYPVCVYGADLAGRLMYANPIGEIYVPSFLERGETLPTYLQAALLSKLNLASDYPDIKWVTFGVGKNTNSKRYVQWVGDSITYIDAAGNVVANPATAVFCSISIQSLYNFNVGNNFSTLAKYEFVKGDRLRILDDGHGKLLSGNPIDIQILGTNYNQAAISALLLPQPENTVLNTAGSVPATNITLYVRYDPRLDSIIKSTGFWIEMYTPMQTSDIFPYNEAAGFYPVVNGEIATFKEYGRDGTPQYNYPNSINIDFWDTYLIQRNISVPLAGDKYFNHPFESPNVNDSFGGNLSSGGRQWVKNDNAKRQWFYGDTVRSDVLLTTYLLNGIGTFRGSNRKDFSAYPWGGIVSVHSERSLVFFLCENDWFMTNFDFNYTYPNEQGIMVVSLDKGLSSPHQKTSGKFGCTYRDIGTVVYANGLVSWFDFKNAAQVICDYNTAEDVADINEKKEGDVIKVGIKSYLTAKCNYIANYNTSNGMTNRFDIVSGIDLIRNNIYLTFRKRVNSSNNPLSFVNNRRNVDLTASETFVYSLQSRRWIMLVGFTPECYGVIRGTHSGIDMVTYAAGIPYRHNYSGNNSFNNFYGVQTEVSFIAIFNKERSTVKVLQNTVLDVNGSGMYIDLVYSDDAYSFSYIPLNLFRAKKNQLYASLLRNMVSYPSMDRKDSFRSMLVDGKRVKGSYFIIRIVGDPGAAGQYFEFKNIYLGYIASEGESILTGGEPTKA